VGRFVAPLFDTTKINVLNRAVGGLSARTLISQGYWDRVLTLVKPGDFVMVEFGHNDASPVNDTLRARGVLRGIGRDSVIVDNLITKQKGESSTASASICASSRARRARAARHRSSTR
jgi:lysophospholipase L1-like esterase